MVKKQIKNSYIKLENVLIIAGFVLLAVGCIANIYGTYTNIRFVRDPIDAIYYMRYLVLLIGGFVAGYLFTRGGLKSKLHDKLFGGVVYSVIAFGIFELLDIARLVILKMLGYPSLPWGKLVFEGTPELSIIIVIFIAYLVRRKLMTPSSSGLVKGALILPFIIYQIYELVVVIYYAAIGAGTGIQSSPMWMMIGGYLITPMVVALVAYLCLSKVRRPLDRLFYAVLIAAIGGVLFIVLWEFRTDPTYNATNTFYGMVQVATLAYVAAMLWSARRATLV